MRRIPLLLAVLLGLTAVAPVAPVHASSRAGSGAILFVSDRDSTPDLVIDDVYALVPRTGRTYRLTSDPDVVWHSTLSPDGWTMAFVHLPVGDGDVTPEVDDEVRTCAIRWRRGELACGPERTLVPSGQVFATSPLSWSRDGRSLPYAGVDPVGGDVDIFSVRVRGEREPVNLTQEAPGRPVTVDAQPNVSADGRTFVYTSQGDIYRRDIDGSNPVQLTGGDRVDVHPELSPDGRRVAFHTVTPDDFDVWAMDARPEGLDNPAVNLTAGRIDEKGRPTQERFPSWSPDGRRIAYMWHLEYDTSNQFFSGWDEGEIYSMRPDGTGVRNETDNNEGTTDPPGDILPDWGPLPRALRHGRS